MSACLEPCRYCKSKFTGEASNTIGNSVSPCKWSMFCYCRPSSCDHTLSVSLSPDCLCVASTGKRSDLDARERVSLSPDCLCVASTGKRSDLDAREREDGDVADQDEGGRDSLWVKIQEEARKDVAGEPMLSGYYQDSILSHDSFEKALGNHLSLKLSGSSLPQHTLREIFSGVLSDDPEIVKSARCDLGATKERDPACISYVHCLLNSKGFLACQAHRIAHRLWSQGRHVAALLIQNRVSEIFAVDIHPGATIGRGILLDHMTGLVLGETAVVGDNVSILHSVTLGGTGKETGDRHPKIGNEVMIRGGTYILGNIRIGDGATIGAGSVVLKDVPAGATAVGNPAKLVGGDENPTKLEEIPSLPME